MHRKAERGIICAGQVIFLQRGDEIVGKRGELHRVRVVIIGVDDRDLMPFHLIHAAAHAPVVVIGKAHDFVGGILRREVKLRNVGRELINNGGILRCLVRTRLCADRFALSFAAADQKRGGKQQRKE